VVITPCSVTLLPKDGYSEGVYVAFVSCQDWDVLYGENQCAITITFEDENLPNVRSKTQAMLVMLFDMEGQVHCEFLPEGDSMNQTAYRMVLQCLQHAVLWELPHR
jgi:Transposase.